MQVVSELQSCAVLRCCRPLYRPRSIIWFTPHFGVGRANSSTPRERLSVRVWAGRYSEFGGSTRRRTEQAWASRSPRPHETVAKLIIELAKNGERDPKKLCEDALK